MNFKSHNQRVGFALAVTAAAASFVLPAMAQDSEHDWTRTYQTSTHPRLALEAGDSGMEIHSCGSCSSIRISVHTDRKLSDYTLVEHQEGEQVSFSLKERMHLGIHVNINLRSKTQVTVETPLSLSLDARVSDGSIVAHGLTGDLRMQSSDGSVKAEDVHGTLNFKTSDGTVAVSHASGHVDARSSDGSLDVDGNFDQLNLHTSDGSVTLALAEGSKLTAPSRVDSSDGNVRLRLPGTLDADLDVSAGDGHIECALPLRIEGFKTKGSGSHHVAGHLNAGGTPLAVHTSDGSVKITAL